MEFCFYRLYLDFIFNLNGRAKLKAIGGLELGCGDERTNQDKMESVTVLNQKEMDEMFDKKRYDSLRKELADFQKCVHQNFPLLSALCEIWTIDGAGLDPSVCQPVDREVRRKIAQDAVISILKGKGISGEEENWRVGCFGSRWFDMNGEKYGVDSIRAAFYSKKFYKDQWEHDKPYCIEITVEKER